MNTNANTNVSGFIQETKSIVDNYEKEIEFLRLRIFEMDKENKNFNINLKKIEMVVIKKEFFIPSNEKITFLNHMKYFSNKEPDVIEIAKAYNEKVAELFDENEKLNKRIKTHTSKEKEIESLQINKLNLEKCLQEKEDQINNVHEVYSQKFNEVFIENFGLNDKINELTRVINEIENNFISDKMSSKEIIGNFEIQIKQYEENALDYKRKIEDQENFRNKITSLEAEKITLKDENNRLKDDKKDLETKVQILLGERNKAKNDLEMSNKELINIQTELKKIQQENSSFIEIISKENSVKNDQNSLFRQELKTLELELEMKKAELVKLNKLVEEGRNDIELLQKQQIEERLNIDLKIKQKEIDLEDMSKVATELEDKLNLKNLEIYNLKEVIEQEKFKLDDLIQFKLKAERDSEGLRDIHEENESLKIEIKLLNIKLEKELIKSENIIGKQIEQAERDQSVLENKNKAIESLKQINENFKSKISLLEEEIKDKTLDLQEEINKYVNIVEESNYKILELEEEIKKEKKDKIKENSIVEGSSFNENKMEHQLDLIKINVNVANHNLHSSELLKKLIVDKIYYLYLYDNSLNLPQMIDILLNNFGLFMDTIFIHKEKDNYNFSFSLIHEFLEDIYFQIYDLSIKSIMNDDDKILKKDIWITNSDQITFEMIHKIANRILNGQNNISLLNSLKKKQNSIDDIIEIFIYRYEKIFNSEVGISLTEFIQKEVRSALVEKVEIHNRCLFNELQTLIKHALNNLNLGKIVYKNKEVYDFKQFFVEYLSRDIKNSEIICGSQNIITSEAVDNLVFSIKMNSENLKGLYFNGSFNTNSPNTQASFSKLCLTIMFYSTRIVDLRITNCQFAENQLAYLIKVLEYMKNLKHLDLSGNNIKESGLKILSENLKINKTIQSLFLNKNDINATGGFYLADSFMKNNYIEKLSLSSNNINDTGLSCLLTVLCSNNSIIKFLDLSNNSLKINDFKNLAELIQTSTTLKIINLSSNVIEPESAHYLGLSIKNSISLSAIHLQNTNLNDENTPLLLKNINNTKITEFYLDFNPVGDISTILLSNNLKLNTEVKFISLRKCNLTSMSLICLSKLFEINQKLEFLNLEDNNFDDNSIVLLNRTIRNRNIKIYLTSSLLSSKAKDVVIKNTENYILK